MQKYTALVTHADPLLPDGVHDIYVASDVDARIAELKQWLEQEIDLHPSQYPDFTGGYCSALEDVLKKFNALMGT